MLPPIQPTALMARTQNPQLSWLTSTGNYTYVVHAVLSMSSESDRSSATMTGRPNGPDERSMHPEHAEPSRASTSPGHRAGAVPCYEFGGAPVGPQLRTPYSGSSARGTLSAFSKSDSAEQSRQSQTSYLNGSPGT